MAVAGKVNEGSMTSDPSGRFIEAKASIRPDTPVTITEEKMELASLSVSSEVKSRETTDTVPTVRALAITMRMK